MKLPYNIWTCIQECSYTHDTIILIANCAMAVIMVHGKVHAHLFFNGDTSEAMMAWFEMIWPQNQNSLLHNRTILLQRLLMQTIHLQIKRCMTLLAVFNFHPPKVKITILFESVWKHVGWSIPLLRVKYQRIRVCGLCKGANTSAGCAHVKNFKLKMLTRRIFQSQLQPPICPSPAMTLHALG